MGLLKDCAVQGALDSGSKRSVLEYGQRTCAEETSDSSSLQLCAVFRLEIELLRVAALL